MTGLREQKKRQTRRDIGQAAWRLFRQHGFDAVTVDEIAQAAGVSKKTVFNYFPTKEDLVLARAEDREDELVAAVRRVGPELSLVDSFGDLFRASLDRVARLRGESGPGSGAFFDLVGANPALQRKFGELNAHLTRVLADELAHLRSRPAEDPVIGSMAATLLGAQVSLHRSLRRRVASGATDAAIRRAHRRDIDRVCAILRDGLPD